MAQISYAAIVIAISVVWLLVKKLATAIRA